MTYGLEVGAIVIAPDHPDWGRGQVQSIIGSRITVTFENRGKTVLIGEAVTLDILSTDES